MFIKQLKEGEKGVCARGCMYRDLIMLESINIYIYE